MIDKLSTVSELIEYHQKKCDWFRNDKERRQFHERMLQFLTRDYSHEETGELFDE